MNIFTFSLIFSFALIKGQEICQQNNVQCNKGYTCCSFNGKYGCCPMKFTCAESGELCISSNKRIQIPWNEPKKIKNQQLIIPFKQPNACPGGQAQCPTGETCCQMSGGQEGCCPYPNAVCCSDQIHCCPSGYTCDVSEGLCYMDDKKVKIPWNEPKKIKNHQLIIPFKQPNACPEGQAQCPTGETCCPMSGGQEGCCPYPNAVCCSDQIHCCPSGYTCDVSGGLCYMDDKKVKIPRNEPKKTKNIVHKN